MRLARSIRPIFSLLAILVLVAPSFAIQVSGPFWNRDVAKAWKVTQTGTRPMLLFITMDGCTYCEKMKYDTYSDAGVKTTIQKSFVAATAKAEENPGLVQRFQIQSFPQTIIFAPNGQILDTIVGYISPARMKQRLQAVMPRRTTPHLNVRESKK